MFSFLLLKSFVFYFSFSIFDLPFMFSIHSKYDVYKIIESNK